MNKERMKVLEMVESGKLSVDEASKLLEALKQSAGRFESYGVYGDFDDASENLNKFSQTIDTFAKDVSEKMGSLFKEVEPKLRTATKTVIEKTVNVVDEISKSLNESLKNMEESKDRCYSSKEEECCTDNEKEDCCNSNNDAYNEKKPGEN